MVLSPTVKDFNIKSSLHTELRMHEVTLDYKIKQMMGLFSTVPGSAQYPAKVFSEKENLLH